MWMCTTAALRQRRDRGQLGRRHGAQTVRRHTDARPGERLHGAATGLQQAREAVRGGDEALLARAGGGAAEAGVRVEDRQQREADAGGAGGRGDTRSELAALGERLAVAVVVQIVELAHVGEARLEHLREAQGADRLEFIGPETLDEAVHELTPAPEAVGVRTAPFREAGQSALEGVAVHVRQAGHGDGVTLIVGGRRRIRCDAGDATVAHGKAHARRPTGRQQCRLKPQAPHGVHYALRRLVGDVRRS